MNTDVFETANKLQQQFLPQMQGIQGMNQNLLGYSANPNQSLFSLETQGIKRNLLGYGVNLMQRLFLTRIRGIEENHNSEFLILNYELLCPLHPLHLWLKKDLALGVTA